MYSCWYEVVRNNGRLETHYHDYSFSYKEAEEHLRNLIGIPTVVRAWIEVRTRTTSDVVFRWTEEGGFEIL